MPSWLACCEATSAASKVGSLQRPAPACLKTRCMLCSLQQGVGADLLPLLSGVRSMSLLEGSGGSAGSLAAGPPLGMRGHYIDAKPGHRRMAAVGSNQNKAITKRLASAGHYQQVCNITNCSLERHARGGSTNAREGILKECLVRAVLDSSTCRDVD